MSLVGCFVNPSLNFKAGSPKALLIVSAFDTLDDQVALEDRISDCVIVTRGPSRTLWQVMLQLLDVLHGMWEYSRLQRVLCMQLLVCSC